jgi:hypothetical protein
MVQAPGIYALPPRLKRIEKHVVAASDSQSRYDQKRGYVFKRTGLVNSFLRWEPRTSCSRPFTSGKTVDADVDGSLSEANNSLLVYCQYMPVDFAVPLRFIILRRLLYLVPSKAPG